MSSYLTSNNKDLQCKKPLINQETRSTNRIDHFSRRQSYIKSWQTTTVTISPQTPKSLKPHKETKHTTWIESKQAKPQNKCLLILEALKPLKLSWNG